MNKIIWEPVHLDFVDDKSEEENDEDEYNPDEEYDELSEIHEALKLKITKQVYNTPFGIMDVSNKLNPYKTYHLWIMNTNFTLTQKKIELLSKLPGIEVLKPIARYRAIIAVGKCFKFSDVRQEIYKLFQIGKSELILPDKAKDAIAECKQYKYWGVCVMPNGNIDSVHSDNLNDISDTLAVYNSAKEAHTDTVVVTHEQS